jgi:hypothetical protein
MLSLLFSLITVARVHHFALSPPAVLPTTAMTFDPCDKPAIPANRANTIVGVAAIVAGAVDSISNGAGIDGIINAISATAKTASAEGGEGGNRHARVVSSTTAQGQEGFDFPLWYLCPFDGGEPPVDGTYFDVPGSNVRQRNVHLNFSAEGNDPSSQFATLSQAYLSIEVLMHTVAQAMAGPQQPQTLANLLREYMQASTNLANATKEHVRIFQRRILQGLHVELDKMVPEGMMNANGGVSNANSGANMKNDGDMENAH